MKGLVATLALGVVLAFTGCGGGDSGPEESAEPAVTVPDGPPPKHLVVRDLAKGSGPAVKVGDEVTVKWVGVLYKRHRQFYSSWKDRHPFTFLTDAGRVIPGWDRGVIGMRVGGRRELIIPPPLGYEDTGTTSVPPNETLIYVVDLLAIR